MVLYHGSDVIVRNPEVRKTRYAKDFSWGFYCTSNYEQAARANIMTMILWKDPWRMTPFGTTSTTF